MHHIETIADVNQNGIVTIDYLFDTNILIYLLNNSLTENLPSGRYGCSFITEIELLCRNYTNT